MSCNRKKKKLDQTAVYEYANGNKLLKCSVVHIEHLKFVILKINLLKKKKLFCMFFILKYFIEHLFECVLVHILKINFFSGITIEPYSWHIEIMCPNTRHIW